MVLDTGPLSSIPGMFAQSELDPSAANIDRQLFLIYNQRRFPIPTHRGDPNVFFDAGNGARPHS